MRRGEDSIPLRRKLAEDLSARIRNLTPAAQVFKVPRHTHWAAVFRQDLGAAGIRDRDNAGKVADFHALRHNFISNLATGVMHPKMAQALARHATITLSMGRYTHGDHGEQSEAYEAFQDLPPIDRKKAQATGTNYAGRQPRSRALCWAQNHGRRETSGDFGILIPLKEAVCAGVGKFSKNKDSSDKYRAKPISRRGARAAEGAGLENRCGACVTVGSNPTLSVCYY